MKADSLDIRIPIGLLFAVLGGLLAAYGLVSDRAIYQRHSLGININLGWGLVMLAFGLVMIALGRRTGTRPPEAT
ncbi:MAG TPA: hypothetical protein VF590_10395 [Isosphaeraceae bacterium]|jgi:hypothetical protein